MKHIETSEYKQIESLYFSGTSITDIAIKFDVNKHQITNAINIINDRRKADRVSIFDEMKFLEENLFQMIEQEKRNPTIEMKQIVDNLQDIYAKKLMYV